MISTRDNKKSPFCFCQSFHPGVNSTKRGYIVKMCNLLSVHSQQHKHTNEKKKITDLSFFHRAWKYKHACSMWSEEGWFWLSAGSRRAFSPLLSGASVSSATVLSNKPALSTSRVPCLKAPLPNNTVTLRENKENSQAMLLVFMPSSLYQIPVLSSISRCYWVSFLWLSEWQEWPQSHRCSLCRGDNKWALVFFFLKESIMKLCGGAIQVR